MAKIIKFNSNKGFAQLIAIGVVAVSLLITTVITNNRKPTQINSRANTLVGKDVGITNSYGILDYLKCNLYINPVSFVVNTQVTFNAVCNPSTGYLINKIRIGKLNDGEGTSNPSDAYANEIKTCTFPYREINSDRTCKNTGVWMTASGDENGDTGFPIVADIYFSIYNPAGTASSGYVDKEIRVSKKIFVKAEQSTIPTPTPLATSPSYNCNTSITPSLSVQMNDLVTITTTCSSGTNVKLNKLELIWYQGADPTASITLRTCALNSAPYICSHTTSWDVTGTFKVRPILSYTFQNAIYNDLLDAKSITVNKLVSTPTPSSQQRTQATPTPLIRFLTPIPTSLPVTATPRTNLSPTPRVSLSSTPTPTLQPGTSSSTTQVPNCKIFASAGIGHLPNREHTVTLGNLPSFETNCNNTDKAEVFISPSNQQNWILMNNSNQRNFSTTLPSYISPGDYYLIVNGYKGAANNASTRCTGNPWGWGTASWSDCHHSQSVGQDEDVLTLYIRAQQSGTQTSTQTTTTTQSKDNSIIIITMNETGTTCKDVRGVWAGHLSERVRIFYTGLSGTQYGENDATTQADGSFAQVLTPQAMAAKERVYAQIVGTGIASEATPFACGGTTSTNTSSTNNAPKAPEPSVQKGPSRIETYLTFKNMALKSNGQGLCLRNLEPGSNPTFWGTKFITFDPCTNADAYQFFQIEEVPNKPGVYFIKPHATNFAVDLTRSVNNGCLSIVNYEDKDKGGVHLWECSQGDELRQQWIFVKAPSDNAVFIQSMYGQHRLLDKSFDGRLDPAAVHGDAVYLYSYNNNALNQQWQIMGSAAEVDQIVVWPSLMGVKKPQCSLFGEGFVKTGQQQSYQINCSDTDKIEIYTSPKSREAWSLVGTLTGNSKLFTHTWNTEGDYYVAVNGYRSGASTSTGTAQTRCTGNAFNTFPASWSKCSDENFDRVVVKVTKATSTTNTQTTTATAQPSSNPSERIVRFINRSKGQDGAYRCLSVVGGNASVGVNGAQFETLDCADHANYQRFKLVPIPGSSDTYQIRPVSSDTQCVSVNEYDDRNDGKIHQWGCSTLTEKRQQWHFNAVNGNANIVVINTTFGSGTVLDKAWNALSAAAANGDIIHEWERNNFDNQQWEIRN